MWPFKLNISSDLTRPGFSLNDSQVGELLGAINKRNPADILYLNGKEVPGICRFAIKGGHKVTQSKARTGDNANIKDTGRELCSVDVTVSIYSEGDYLAFQQNFLNPFDALLGQQGDTTKQTKTVSTTTYEPVSTFVTSESVTPGLSAITTTKKVVTKTTVPGSEARNPILRNRSINRLYIESIEGPDIDYSGFVTYKIKCTEVAETKKKDPITVKDTKKKASVQSKINNNVANTLKGKPSADKKTTQPPTNFVMLVQ